MLVRSCPGACPAGTGTGLFLSTALGLPGGMYRAVPRSAVRERSSETYSASAMAAISTFWNECPRRASTHARAGGFSGSIQASQASL